jgi:UDP-glucose 4-epimerase
MTVLVTGASGFAGSSVAQALATAGHHVTALYRTPSRFSTTLQTVARVQLLRGQLRDAARWPGPFEAVVHAAATSPAPQITADRIVEDTALGTQCLLAAAERWRPHAFVLYSSLSVYGTITVPVVDETTAISEPDAYGASKRQCERWLAERAAELPGIALRLPGVVGPGAHRHWLSGVAERLTAGEPVRAFHLDAPFNNAVHVADLSQFVLRLVERRWAGYDAVVLGSRGALDVRSVIRRLAAGLGVTPRIEPTPPTRPSFIVSSERAKALWGYEPADLGRVLDRYAADVLAWRAGDC